MKTKRTRVLGGIAATIASVGLLAGTAGPAIAAPAAAVSTKAAAVVAAAPKSETLYRKGKKTATITPKGAPAGAKVVSGKVTVKKGKKTVAKNKTSYKAKKGTYKVTSTVAYQTLVTKTAAPGDVVSATARVTGRTIIEDYTEFYDYGNGQYAYDGPVAVRYTGLATGKVRIGGVVKTVNWNTSWVQDEYMESEWLSEDPTPAEVEAAMLAATYYVVGDTTPLAGDEMEKLPSYKTWGPKKTVTTTRTVVVK